MIELSQLPAPGKGSEAGYYPDPLGSGRARWWDGTRWTSTIGPKVEADAPLDKPLPPPTKVCPRCAVQAETFAPRCPNCGRTYSRPSAWQIVAIAAAIVVLGVGGCGACIAIGIDELEDTAISEEEFDTAKRGSSREELEARLGEPFESDRDGDRVCITYNDEDDVLFGRFFELCFVNGRLVSKDAY